ncbi:RNA polymerase subunit sigma [Xaviernesmea oryzae]|uniref:RNA polymerase subunit sigma n=1 Tax=Xaviernesmea oryzae TaxID=464029 RepID=A0A1Q9AXQ5_9HYPH|nr:sigma-70 family RNA polymerase sigma factor [Xaviernesmea oryzae]OLP60234.1 RNA polymerase subunit sigma [Xaviernesmea oryzae]SEK27162.1 RNA polymerase sigma-70 factor, ECF subfamily [Xaviernesmea oryzae]
MNGDERRHFAVLADAVAKDRDRAAFAQLFTFFAPRLKSFLMRQNMSAMEAEELVQEVMVVLWNKAHLYDPAKSSLSTWLFRVARNRRIDAARRQRAAKLDENDTDLQPSAPPAPDEVVDLTDREDMVQKAISRLPQEQLQLVQLAFFLGRSHSEIAAETGLPLGTVKSRLRLAFGKLRLLLGEQGIESAS